MIDDELVAQSHVRSQTTPPPRPTLGVLMLLLQQRVMDGWLQHQPVQQHTRSRVAVAWYIHRYKASS